MELEFIIVFGLIVVALMIVISFNHRRKYNHIQRRETAMSDVKRMDRKNAELERRAGVVDRDLNRSRQRARDRANIHHQRHHREDDHDDLLNPLNPLSPMHPANMYNDDEPVRSRHNDAERSVSVSAPSHRGDSCSDSDSITRSSSGYSGSTSYDSGCGSSSSDSGSSSSGGGGGCD